MNKKILVPLIVFGLLVSIMTVNAGNIGIAVTNAATTLQETIITYIARITITSPSNYERFGGTDVNVGYVTQNVSGGATRTYLLNGISQGPMPTSVPFIVPGVDNGLTDGGQLNNVTLDIQDPLNGSAQSTVNFYVDITAPRQITGITNTNGTNYINWTWVNPTNLDFNNTIVNVTNTTGTVVPDIKLPNTTTYYNATGLNPNTQYTISVRTEDNAPAS